MTWGDPGLCGEEGCDRPHEARGYCRRHYQWRRRNGLIITRQRVVGRPPTEDAPGRECAICGRLFWDHAVTEFCELMDRRLAI